MVLSAPSAAPQTVAGFARANTAPNRGCASTQPRHATARPPASIPMDEDDSFMDALDHAAAVEKTAKPINQAARCPKCSASMENGAVLCVNCGWSQRSGQTTATQKVLPYETPQSNSEGRKKPIDRMAPQGPFAAGAILCCIFALVASLLWIVVAWASHLSFGIIAIAIGIAAGIGMQIGHKGYSNHGGYFAAGMTLAAILLAKFAVLELVVLIPHHHTIAALPAAALAYYFFSPVGDIIMLVGLAAAYRCASGTSRGY